MSFSIAIAEAYSRTGIVFKRTLPEIVRDAILLELPAPENPLQLVDRLMRMVNYEQHSIEHIYFGRLNMRRVLAEARADHRKWQALENLSLYFTTRPLAQVQFLDCNLGRTRWRDTMRAFRTVLWHNRARLYNLIQADSGNVVMEG